MLKYCFAVLLVTLAWLVPGSAWAAASAPLLAETATTQVADTPAQISFSDDDITTFAKAYQAVQLLRIKAEGEMEKAIEAEGLTIDRFNAIAELQLDGNTDSPPDMAKVVAKAKVSKKENKQFQSAIDRIVAIRQSTEGEMEKAIEAEGLTITTFNAVLEQSADDTALQRKISDEIVKQTLATAEADS